LLTDALAVEDESSFAAFTHWCAYTAAAEREDYESARDHIVRGEAIIRKFNRTLAFPYIVERHWLGAWKFGEVDAAQTALQELGKDPVGVPKSSLLRLQAAIAQTDRPP
jgi:hypothetical protein